jgi:hypothetical protein
MKYSWLNRWLDFLDSKMALRHSFVFPILASIFVLAAGMIPGVVLAQLPASPHESPPPGFQKVGGLDLDLFRATGEFEQTIRSTDNLLQNSQSIKDIVSVTTAKMNLTGAIRDLKITASGKAVFEIPLERDDKKSDEIEYWVLGQYPVTDKLNLAARYSIDEDEVEVSSADQINGSSDTSTVTESYIVKVDYAHGPYYTKFTGELADVDTIDTNNSELFELDRIEINLTNETGRKAVGATWYGKFMVSQIDYTGSDDAVPQNRNSIGASISFGLRRSFGPVNTEFQATYLNREFEASTIGSFVTFLGHADLHWSVDNANSINFRVERLFLETSVLDSPGIIGKQATVSYRHTFRPDFYADISFVGQQIHAVNSDSEILGYVANAGVHYAVSNTSSLGLSSSYAEQKSDDDSQDTNETRYVVSFRYTF